MNKILCCIAQIGVLVAGLVCGAPALAQEPGFPPETTAPPPKQGPSGSQRGMMDPDEQLARMTTRYSLTTEQQDQVKPILVSQQHQVQGLRKDTALSREDRMAKMQTIRSDSDAKIKAILNDDQKKQFEQDQLRMQKRVRQGQGAGTEDAHSQGHSFQSLQMNYRPCSQASLCHDRSQNSPTIPFSDGFVFAAVNLAAMQAE